MAKKNKKTIEEVKKVEEELKLLETKIEKYPDHFSRRDVINAFFGALIVAMTFVFKGRFFEIVFGLPWTNLIILTCATVLILLGEIYYIGYSRVKNKAARPLIPFIAKRFFTFYTMSIMISTLLVFGFNLQSFANSQENIIKLILVLAMPASFGASLADLVKKYD